MLRVQTAVIENFQWKKLSNWSSPTCAATLRVRARRSENESQTIYSRKQGDHFSVNGRNSVSDNVLIIEAFCFAHPFHQIGTNLDIRAVPVVILVAPKIHRQINFSHPEFS